MATKNTEVMNVAGGEIVLYQPDESISLYSQDAIQSRIFTIRGVQVIMDRDLALMFQVDTKVLNQAVKRNIRRFPHRFMFQLSDEEWTDWKSQFVTTNYMSVEEIQAIKMGVRRPPFVFTEQGISQLSSVLQRFHGRNAGVTLDCYVKSRFATQDLRDAVDQYNAQYPGEPTVLHTFERSHDRWLIIDDSVYHFGASIKDLGKKWFSVNLVTEHTANELIARL